MKQATDRACPYCGEHMPNPRRVQCGKPECKRQWQNARMRRWFRDHTGEDRTYYPKRHTCIVCGVEFWSRKSDARYCSTGVGSCEAQAKADREPHPNTVAGTKARGERRRYERMVAKLTAEPTKTEANRHRRLMRHDPCAYCGESAEALDHIVPKADGGTDGWDNRAAACHQCNSIKGSLPLLAALLFIPPTREYHRLRRILY